MSFDAIFSSASYAFGDEIKRLVNLKTSCRPQKFVMLADSGPQNELWVARSGVDKAKTLLVTLAETQ